MDKLKLYEENGLTFIDFGKYPQTHINDNELITNLNKLKYANINGYYTYEGNEYIKIKASLFVWRNQYNKYSDDSLVIKEDAWFKVEPIKWRVLNNNDNVLTVVSEYLLEPKKFGEKNSNVYNDSIIRNWLITDFYYKAFTLNEKNYIISNYNVNNDNVWLLSKEEAENKDYGFINNESRSAKVTDFSLAMGAGYNANYLSGFWWLRTPYPDSKLYQYYVSTESSILNDFYVEYGYRCARPALLIKLK